MIGPMPRVSRQDEKTPEHADIFRTISRPPALNQQMSIQALPAMPDQHTATPAIVSLLPDAATRPPELSKTVRLPTGVADLSHSEIRHDNGQRDELSVRETELLGYLAANPDRPVSRDEILQRVWHLDPRRLITRTIDMHIANIRGKLREDPGNPKVLFTVRGKGYMFATCAG